MNLIAKFLDSLTWNTGLSWLVGLPMMAGLLFDPNDTQAATEATGYLNKNKFSALCEQLESDPAGRVLLAKKPIIDATTLDFDALCALPDGTLGREYARFYNDRFFDFDSYQYEPPPVVVGDAAYLTLRLHQTHDIWHVVTETPTTVSGEIELQAFTFGHLKTPAAFLIALAGMIQWSRTYPDLIPRMAAAYRRGARARPLASVLWEEHWRTPLAELRMQLQL